MKKNKYCLWVIIVLFLSLGSCEKEEECTRMDTIGGGLLPERQIEVPCDFPEPLPLG
jgi:hypothetical protein